MRAGRAPAVIAERDADDARILTLTLNRPKVLNAYDRSMRDGLFEGLALAAADSSIAVVVLRGAGRAFSSGGDLHEFGTAPSPICARDVRQMRDVWQALCSVPRATIASVHGLAAGGGLEMALLCDLLICTRDARLSLPETALGAIPGVGGTQTLARGAGEGRAAALLLAGDSIDGVEAARIGLASSVVPAARLEATTRRWARRIARLDPGVLAAVLGALRRGRDLRLAEGLSLEKRLARRLPDPGS